MSYANGMKPMSEKSIQRKWSKNIQYLYITETFKNHCKYKIVSFNTLRTGDADLRLYAYKQFKYPVPNVLNVWFKIYIKI
jgi:hypothetical protein